MTTSDEKIVDVSEKVEEVKQRSISELLIILERDNTFQGMTDSEIKSIIEYEKKLARMEGSSEQLQNDMQKHCSKIETMTEQALQQQNNMLQSILERASNLQLKVVQYG